MIKTLASPLVTAANNIVSVGSASSRQLPKFQKDYSNFIRFLTIESKQIERIKLPEKRKIKELANLNVASTFGSPSNLLGSLASGALDVAGFLGNMFPAKGKIGRPQKPGRIKAPSPISKGPNLKMSGMRSIGVANAIFAGLDFATGLAAGESVGKSAAGTGGALAGGLLGGAIGQALIPIPGLGFVIGNIAGSFLGGYAADRVYEGVTGEKSLEQKQTEKLKAQEAKQKALVGGGGSFADAITKFDASVSKFQNGVAQGLFGNISQNQSQDKSSMDDSNIIEPQDPIDTGNKPQGTGMKLEDAEATGGEVPGAPDSGFKTSKRPNHKGNDYSKSVGTPISLIQEGTVTVANMNYDPGGWGALIEVRHKDGSLSRYAHVSKISVASGQKISPGQVIGYTGGAEGAAGSGNSTGPHLHFEYLPSGSGPVDPTSAAKNIFRFGGNVKVKSKTSTSANSNSFVLELHADPNAQGQKTGLIPSRTTGDTPVSQALVSSFGTYGKDFRGGLGVPNRGGNILESDMSKGVDANARRIVEAMMKDPQRKYDIFAGHADVKTGETGAKGEVEYNKKLAETVEILAKQQKLNVTYNRSIIANTADDPNSNFSRIAAIMNNAQNSKISAMPSGKNITSQQIQQYPSYNQSQSSVTIIPMMMANQGGGTQQKPIFIPVGGGGGGGTVIMPGPTEGQVVNSLMKTMLLTNLSAS